MQHDSSSFLLWLKLVFTGIGFGRKDGLLRLFVNYVIVFLFNEVIFFIFFYQHIHVCMLKTDDTACIMGRTISGSG